MKSSLIIKLMYKIILRTMDLLMIKISNSKRLRQYSMLIDNKILIINWINKI